ncbi:MAG: phosphotransferase [Acidimicrobiia bacterium]
MTDHRSEPDAPLSDVPPAEGPPPLDLHAARSLGARVGLAVTGVRAMPGGSRNHSYLLDTPTGRYVGTLLSAHTEASAELLIRLTAHAAAHGITTPAPVLPAAGPSLHWHGVPVLIRPHVDGRVHATRLPAQLLGAAGAALACVHAVPIPSFAPVAVRRLPPDWAERALPADLRSVLAGGARRAVEAGLLQPGRSVFTHGDLFPDNLIAPANGGPLTIIDWEFAGADDPVIDLGVAAVGLCRSPAGGIDIGALDALLGGYHSARCPAVGRAPLRPAGSTPRSAGPPPCWPTSGGGSGRTQTGGGRWRRCRPVRPERATAGAGSLRRRRALTIRRRGGTCLRPRRPCGRRWGRRSGCR